MTTIVTLLEQAFIPDEYIDIVKSLNLNFKEPVLYKKPEFLGITPELRASYYIGADWLNEPDIAVVVRPKNDTVDYLSMLNVVLSFNKVSKYFDDFFCINFSKKPIPIQEGFFDNLTPFLFVSFLYYLSCIFERDIKSDFITRSDNIKFRIKGRVDIRQTILHNFSKLKNNTFYCKYQDFSVNTLENRLLKKALFFTIHYLSMLNGDYLSGSFAELYKQANRFYNLFYHVGDNISVTEINKISCRTNNLFIFYKKAIYFAKLILRRFNYKIGSKSSIQTVPPFWIDMSRLFECYVYHLLCGCNKTTILFQGTGSHKTKTDFLLPDYNLIVDAKYKYQYSGDDELADIRQLSGYSRDKRILEKLSVPAEQFNSVIPNCLIIYPNKENSSYSSDYLDLSKMAQNATPIKNYINFWKIGINLPRVEK